MSPQDLCAVLGNPPPGLPPYRRICYLVQKAQKSPLGYCIFSGSFILFHLIDFLFHHILFYYIWPLAQGGHLSSSEPEDPHMSPEFTETVGKAPLAASYLWLTAGLKWAVCEIYTPPFLSSPFFLASYFHFLLSHFHSLSWMSLFLPPSFPCPHLLRPSCSQQVCKFWIPTTPCHSPLLR